MGLSSQQSQTPPLPSPTLTQSVSPINHDTHVVPTPSVVPTGSLAEGDVGNASDNSCWRDGYTFAGCCDVQPMVATLNGCWDQIYNRNRCCHKTSTDVNSVLGTAVN